MILLLADSAILVPGGLAGFAASLGGLGVFTVVVVQKMAAMMRGEL